MRKPAFSLVLSVIAVTTALTASAAQQTVDPGFDFRPGDVVRFHSKGDSYPDQTRVVVACRDRGNRLAYSCDMRMIEPSVQTTP